VPGSVAPARGLIPAGLADVVGRADGTICVGFGPSCGTVLSLSWWIISRWWLLIDRCDMFKFKFDCL
jgi:hypothetical protein